LLPVPKDEEVRVDSIDDLAAVGR